MPELDVTHLQDITANITRNRAELWPVNVGSDYESLPTTNCSNFRKVISGIPSCSRYPQASVQGCLLRRLRIRQSLRTSCLGVLGFARLGIHQATAR